MLKQKEQKQIEKDTIQRKELRYGYLIPSDWNYEKMNQTKSKSESAGHRAWLEIDRKALEHNVCLFQRLLPDTCQLMPAVKAQAYGLGADRKRIEPPWYSGILCGKCRGRNGATQERNCR